jgi:hypothetical protein
MALLSKHLQMQISLMAVRLLRQVQEATAIPQYEVDHNQSSSHNLTKARQKMLEFTKHIESIRRSQDELERLKLEWETILARLDEEQYREEIQSYQAINDASHFLDTLGQAEQLLPLLEERRALAQIAAATLDPKENHNELDRILHCLN